MNPLPTPKFPNTIFSSYDLRSLRKNYLEKAAEEGVCLTDEMGFDYDFEVFDKNPTENALSWLSVIPLQV